MACLNQVCWGDEIVGNAYEPMMEMFIFETNQLLEQLEQLTMQSEKNGAFHSEDVNEIFRIMHTIKGSAAMMLVNEVSSLSHSIEDVFFYIREQKPANIDYSSLADVVLAASDFIKNEIAKLEDNRLADGSAKEFIDAAKAFLDFLKEKNGGADKPAESNVLPVKQQYYIGAAKNAVKSENLNVFFAVISYEDGCEMENVRAYMVLNSLQGVAEDIFYRPENILEDETSAAVIKENGFKLCFTTERAAEEIEQLLNQTIFLENLEFKQLASTKECDFWPQQAAQVKEIVLKDLPPIKPILPKEALKESEHDNGKGQSMISVNVHKLDLLMDLVGELVIAEAMVTHNPDLKNMQLENFNKAARQLRKISGELQDSVMSIRMVPLRATFQKMNRLVRDMSKKLAKKVELVLLGEDIEVDKNVIEHISDPLMHLIRNSLDHGIELPQERQQAGKPITGKIILQAYNAGNEVIIDIVDDGKGLNREKILARAKENNLLVKSDLTDKEIYAFIFAPGFSTKEKVTEFSGRGVGMDVVVQNIKAIGGSILLDSKPGIGSTFKLKIPLTLAIIEGMTVAVGLAAYTIPIMSVREAFRPKEKDILLDPNGGELIMLRGECYPVVRLHKFYNIKTDITSFTEGIIIMVEAETKTIGIFADCLLGVQQIVVKPVPQYIKNISDMTGISGCTLLGNGNISLILDVISLNSKI